MPETQLTTKTIAAIRRHGLAKDPRLCLCKHKLQGTGAVFFQSVGVLECTTCGGFQSIRKPIH